jgi:SAM-dependent methyltransferase
MPRALRSACNRAPLLGGVYRTLARARRAAAFAAQFRRFRRMARGADSLPLRWSERMPCLDDATAATGFDRHYVYHTAWAARVLAETRPAEHVDIGSSLYFPALVSAFLPVRFYDYRPPDLRLDNLECAHADLLALPFADGSVASLSCMHVIEHVGLARYGDPMDPDGDRKALAELSRVLAPGGALLLAVPVGRPRIVFNAHRVYAPEHLDRAMPGLVRERFALIPEHGEQGGLVPDPPEELVRAQEYGCGCFLYRKPGGDSR